MDKTLQIGNVRLENPFIAAPMAGVSDCSYRSIVREMGAAMAVTEMVSGKGLMYHNKKTEQLLKIYPGEKPVSFQIFGSEPDVMRETARMLESYDNDILDINMGCPVPKVVKNGEGSALLKDLDRLYEVAKATVDATEKPVTVKIRIGWDDNHIVACEAAKAAEEAGVKAVAVHGRTREQYYSGKADRKIIAEVKKAIGIPLIGNGDIFTAQDAMSMMDETGCDFVMIGRGMLGNPWIFKECQALWKEGKILQPPQADERRKIAKLHLERLCDLKGENVAVREMRRHLGWYTKGMPGSTEIRRVVNNITDVKELLALINRM